MATLSPPKRVTLAFVHRKTGSIHKKKLFAFRNELQAFIKMWAWVYAHRDEYPPESYRLVAYVEEGPYPEFIVSKLRSAGIRVIEPRGGVLEVYK